MCGICGLASLDGGDPVGREQLAWMSEALVHRGPDSGGALIDGAVGLAARRLAVIDLADGDQPISSEDGRVHVVQNGEIYNHRELHAELISSGHRFATRCDTEVLVHLYEERGPRFVEALRGMFALAVWDAGHRRLVLARDPHGIKPLYYRVAGGTLSFASELRALARQPGFSREVDLRALEAFLAFNSIPAPLSIHREARKLPPGHVLVWEEGGRPRLERYARPRPASAGALRAESPGALAAELRSRLRDSVRAQLVADVPVGVLLSGGVDSSALTALAAEESAGRVSTFSIGFAERSFDELDRARRVARRYGTDHHELVVRPDAALLFPALARAFDEPFGDSSALPAFLVSELAARHVKVALSGEGADELFGGYYTYVADVLAPRLGPAAAAAAPLVERLPSSSGRVSLDYRAKRFARVAHLPPLERHHGWKEIFSGAQRARLVAPDWREGGGDTLASWRQRFAETADSPLLARLQDVDLGIYLVDDLLVKTDRMSMAHGLEARVPFLDSVVAELALALPTGLKVRGLAKKRLLRRAAEPLIPRQIVRARKRGFSIPAAAWLRGELEPLARELLAPERTASQGFFEPAVARELLDDHLQRRQDNSRQLWGLMCFSLWAEQTAGSPTGC